MSSLSDDDELYKYVERIRQLEQALAEAHQREALGHQELASAQDLSGYVPRRAYDVLLAL